MMSKSSCWHCVCLCFLGLFLFIGTPAVLGEQRQGPEATAEDKLTKSVEQRRSPFAPFPAPALAPKAVQPPPTVVEPEPPRGRYRLAGIVTVGDSRLAVLELPGNHFQVLVPNLPWADLEVIVIGSDYIVLKTPAGKQRLFIRN